MNGMERRLRAVEDRLEILDLEAAYAVAWDFGRAQEWAELFTADGWFEMIATGSMPYLRVTGHAELRGFCEQRECRKAEFAADPSCVRLKEAEQRRLFQ